MSKAWDNFVTIISKFSEKLSKKDNSNKDEAKPIKIGKYDLKDCLTLGLYSFTRKSVLHGVYVGFGVLIILLFGLYLLSNTNIRSMNSSIIYITDSSMPILNSANDMELELLMSDLQLNTVLNQKNLKDLEVETKAYKSQFFAYEDSLNKFLEVSQKNEVIAEQLAQLATLSAEYSKLVSDLPEKQKEYLETKKILDKEKAEFAPWLSLFRNEEDSVKQSITDDFVKDIILQLLTYQGQVESIATEILLSNDATKIEESLKNLKVKMSVWNENIENLKFEMPEIENNIGQYINSFKQTMSDEKKGLIYRQVASVKNLDYIEKNKDKAYDKLLEIKDVIAKMHDLSQQEIKRSTTRSKTVYEKSSWVMGSAVVIALFIAFITVWLLGASIRRPMRVLLNGLKNVASGDMKDKVIVKESNEFGLLSVHVNELSNKVAGALYKIVEASKKLKEESANNLETSATVEEALDKQRLETISVASAMNEMTHNSREVATSASKTLEEVQHVDHVASQSREIMNETLESADVLSNKIQETTKVISDVNTMSENIGKIIGVIKGVADKTNLLALNAAIEAARAGEYGRGFAVVADEVRTLANTTASSTNEIKGMISELQSSVAKAVSYANECIEEMEKTKENSFKTRESIDEMKNAIARIADMSTIIAQSAEEQGLTADSINENMSKISELGDENVAKIQILVNSNKELDKLSAYQASLVNRFSLPTDIQDKDL